jgi:hypothetical protein
MPVRFTASEIKSNLKFLFTTALIVAVMTFFLQIVLMRYEKLSEEIYTELNQTESEISQYRNLIWLIHNNNTYASSFASEYLEVSRTMQTSKIDLIKENFVRIRAAVEGIGLENYLDTHDHNTCISFMAMAREYIEDFRETKIIESIQLQEKVDVINTIILGLLSIIGFLFVYALLYSIYGK